MGQAESATAALNIIADGWPQTLLVAHVVPDMHGLRLVQPAHTTPATAELPIVRRTTIERQATVVDTIE